MTAVSLGMPEAAARQLAERRRKVDLSGEMFSPDQAVRQAA